LRSKAVRHEREISNAGGITERDKCKPALLRLSLTGNLKKTLFSLYGTEWSERGYGVTQLFLTTVSGTTRYEERLTWSIFEDDGFKPRLYAQMAQLLVQELVNIRAVVPKSMHYHRAL
jgi:hypothetical protein